MRSAVKITFCVFCAFILAFSLTACVFSEYDGEHKDLYAVAVNNVFAVRGYLSNGEVSYNPEIYIIEKDDYGRILFFYSEYYDDSSDPQTDYGMAFVIMQKSENGYAYYYQDICYVPYFDTTSDWDAISDKIDNAILERLKELNDWGREFNDEKCLKVKINSKKPKGVLRPQDYELDEIIYPYEVKNGYTGEDDSFCKFSIYCEADSYGRELYYVYGMTMNTLENGEKEFGYYEYAIILNADGTCSDNGIVRIPTPEDSFTIIKELKLSNNWNLSN